MSPRVANYNDRLADYVDVKERIRLFYEKHPDGRLVTSDVRATIEPDGVPRVWVEAAAYRTPDDPLPGRGWSWLVLPGSTPYTKGSELENAETSAWGRAIGSLGIGIERSIASQDEVNAKEGEEHREAARTDDGGLIGVAEIGKGQADFELRQTPEGFALAFRLVQGRHGIKVVAHDRLAEGLALIKADVIGKRVTCFGHISDETFRPRGATKDVTYQVLTLARIEGPDFVLPAPAPAPDELDAIAEGLPA
jgi:hypothetical protein